jgi:hypothetical protein
VHLARNVYSARSDKSALQRAVAVVSARSDDGLRPIVDNQASNLEPRQARNLQSDLHAREAQPEKLKTLL